MKKLQVIFFALSIFLTSCEEDNVEKYPKKFSYETIQKLHYKAFTKEGEINDPILIEKIINKYPDFAEGPSYYETLYTKTAFNFLTPDEVVIINPDETENRNVIKTESVIYLESRDTTMGVGVSLKELNKFKKFSPLYAEESLIPTSNGVEPLLKLKRCYYIKEENNQIILPLLDIQIRTPYRYYHEKGMNNEFDIKSFSDLGIEDTLLIRQSYIYYNETINNE
ncbi:hypothetical protein [Tenacibaculum sp.]|uniref:hypothetical protein n=1 Tax=Tenacibaculum sp. TaxID=1906242 RepID=UPI003AA7AD34